VCVHVSVSCVCECELCVCACECELCVCVIFSLHILYTHMCIGMHREVHLDKCIYTQKIEI